MSEPIANEEAKRLFIIIKKGGDHDPHGVAWKIAFADFVIVLFALLIVFWNLMQSQEVKVAVETNSHHSFNHGLKLVNENRARPDNTSDVVDTKKLKKSSTEQPELMIRICHAEPPKEVDDVRSFQKIRDEMWIELAKESSFRRFKDNVMIELIEEGLVIQFVEQPGSELFEKGSTEFRARIKQAIVVIAGEIKRYPKNKMEIDGHGIQIAGVFGPEQKWLASTMLADLMRVQLVDAGVNIDQIAKVAGCADSRPLIATNKSDPLNQRISILVRPRQWRPERY